MDIAEAHMIFGGIPYYLNYFRKGMSLGQNVDQLLFDRRARLTNEFNRLFSSLFNNSADYKAIVRLLAKKHMGYARGEIAKLLERKSGGALTDMLASLEMSGFIRHYVPLGNKKSELIYQLCDPFCRFYIAFVENATDPHFWQNSRNDGSIAAWRGLAFEELCVNHVEKIKDALRVGGVLSRESSLSIKGDASEKGTQIDLVIIRNDNIVNLCEMKFTSRPFTIDKDYHDTLLHRIDLLREYLHDESKSIHLTFITSCGLRQNQYSGIVRNEVCLQQLL